MGPEPSASDFHLAPKAGQDDVQQWFDRYDCDSWARGESGYDSSTAQTRRASQAHAEEYVRDMTACLTQRGYEAHYVAAQPPTPPPAVTYTEVSPPAGARELRYRPLILQVGGGYTLVTGSTTGYLENGPSAGAALSWFPSAALPVGLRLEGSYSWFTPGAQLLNYNGIGYNRGETGMYGGDIDLRVNLSRLPARQQLYLAAGVGWYRIDTTLQKLSGERVCGTNFCGVFGTLLAEEHDQSAWQSSWNAGLGWEIALDEHTAFFIEARYRRIQASQRPLQLVPIWLGLRF